MARRISLTRVALIGLGRWGRKLARVLDEHSDLVVCCNTRGGEAHDWVREHYPNTSVTVDIKDVLRDESVDAIVIATPIATHADLARRALAAGKHVFVEKPMAMSVSECSDLVRASREADRRLFVGHVFLFHPVLQELHRHSLEDPFRYIRASWSKFGTFEEDLIWNLVSHDVALNLHLFGEDPTHVSVLARAPARTEMDFIAARLDFSGNRSCHIQVDRCAGASHKQLTVVTRSGKVLLWKGDTLFRLDNSSFEPIFKTDEDSLSLEVTTFLRSIEDPSIVLSDADFGLRVVQVLSEMTDPLSDGVH